MFVREHIEEIDRVVNGQNTTRDTVVQESWLRCINDYGLDPQKEKPPRIVTDATLRAHRGQSQSLISLARNGLETLFRQVVGQNYVLLLADQHGITVDFFGDPSFELELRQSGLYLGSDWSEKVMGTSGVGVCIETAAPVTIHQRDHFNVSQTRLSCTAAPIFDTSGDLAAVLDLSLLRPPQTKVTQNLTLKLIKASVRRIETANLMVNCRANWVMHLSELPERLDIDPDASIALDGSGRIVGVTGAAARILKNLIAHNSRFDVTLIGQRIADFFDVETNELPTFTYAVPVEKRLIHMTNGLGFFVRVKPPSHEHTIVSRESTQLPKRLVSLGYTDPSMKEVVDVAAKVADGNAPILIIGETGVGKQHLAKAIHEARPFSEHFVVVDCTKFEDWLKEEERSSNVFVMGNNQKSDPFERAAWGTLFLDEIADLSPIAQKALLSVLKGFESANISSNQTSRRRMKVLSCTSADVEAMVADGSFRRDLFFHLAATTLRLPPLRNRSDFDWLLDRLLRLRSVTYPYSYKLTSSARLELQQRHWPGNFRELINVLDIALALTNDNVIELEHLPPPVLSEAGDFLFQRSLPEQADDLQTTLRVCGWNISRAARRLGVNRTTIHRRMDRLGISRPD